MLLQYTNATSPYDPDRLLDALSDRLALDDDAQLACRLKVARPVLTMIRRRELAVSAPMLSWMHAASGMPVEQLRLLLGERRGRGRPPRAGDEAVLVSLRRNKS